MPTTHDRSPTALLDSREAAASAPAPWVASSFNGRELELLGEALRESIADPSAVRARCERDWAAVTGAAHAVACNSGEAAMLVAATSVGWGPGDEVLASPFDHEAAERLRRGLGIDVRFVDVDPGALQPTAAAYEQQRTSRTRGVLVADLVGHGVQRSDVDSYASWHGISVVHDARRVLPTSEADVPTTWPVVLDTAPDCVVATGAQGVVLAGELDLAARCRAIAVGLDPELRDLDRCGLDLRASALSCAVAIAQLEKARRAGSMGRLVADEYALALADVDDVTVTTTVAAASAWVAVRAASAALAQRIAVEVAAVGASTSPVRGGAAFDDCPVARDVATRTVHLPSHHLLAPQLQARIIHAVRAAAR